MDELAELRRQRDWLNEQIANAERAGRELPDSCHGCSKRVTPLPVPPGAREIIILGQRANGMLGGHPLPDGRFAWCLECAQIAFRAVRAVRPGR